MSYSVLFFLLWYFKQELNGCNSLPLGIYLPGRKQAVWSRVSQSLYKKLKPMEERIWYLLGWRLISFWEQGEKESRFPPPPRWGKGSRLVGPAYRGWDSVILSVQCEARRRPLANSLGSLDFRNLDSLPWQGFSCHMWGIETQTCWISGPLRLVDQRVQQGAWKAPFCMTSQEQISFLPWALESEFDFKSLQNLISRKEWFFFHTPDFVNWGFISVVLMIKTWFPQSV